MIEYYNIVEEQRTIIQILKQNVPWMNIFLSQWVIIEVNKKSLIHKIILRENFKGT